MNYPEIETNICPKCGCIYNESLCKQCRQCGIDMAEWRKSF